eukprot:TRINITY_DN29712_c0_g1_i1.p1 TRINITY_DN29712_c0_g1~~TRINITY_DN29712_c0_g1_i1.p1  ORF type:complete len:480 (-),score=146.62 TRINITY_DN29712_c0_g1_i1:361-1800(-)
MDMDRSRTAPTSTSMASATAAMGVLDSDADDPEVAELLAQCLSHSQSRAVEALEQTQLDLARTHSNVFPASNAENGFLKSSIVSLASSKMTQPIKPFGLDNESELVTLREQLERAIAQLEASKADAASQIAALKVQLEEARQGIVGESSAAWAQVNELTRRLEEQRAISDREMASLRNQLDEARRRQGASGSTQEASRSSAEFEVLKGHILDLQGQWEDKRRVEEETAKAHLVELTQQLEEARGYKYKEAAARAEVAELTKELEESRRSVSSEVIALKEQVVELARQLTRRLDSAREMAWPEEAPAAAAHSPATKQSEDAGRNVAGTGSTSVPPDAISQTASMAHRQEVEQLKTQLLDAKAEASRLQRELQTARAAAATQKEETGTNISASATVKASSEPSSDRRLHEALLLLASREKQLFELTAELDNSRRKIRDMNEELAKVSAFLSGAAPKKTNRKQAKTDASVLPKIEDGRAVKA